MNRLCNGVLIFKLPVNQNVESGAIISFKENISALFFNEITYEKDKVIKLFTEQMKPVDIAPNGMEPSLLLLEMTWVAEDKKNLLVALKYLDSMLNIPVFEPVYESLEFVEKQISLLKNLLIKYVVTNIKNDEKIKRTIENIYQTDNEIIYKLYSVLNDTAVANLANAINII